MRVYDGAPKRDIKIILGDLNAKIGSEHIYSPTIGKYSLHENSNDNGLRIIDFALSTKKQKKLDVTAQMF